MRRATCVMGTLKEIYSIGPTHAGALVEGANFYQCDLFFDLLKFGISDWSLVRMALLDTANHIEQHPEHYGISQFFVRNVVMVQYNPLQYVPSALELPGSDVLGFL